MAKLLNRSGSGSWISLASVGKCFPTQLVALVTNISCASLFQDNLLVKNVFQSGLWVFDSYKTNTVLPSLFPNEECRERVVTSGVLKTFLLLHSFLQWESNGPKECEQVGTICQILFPQTLQTKSNMEQNYPHFLKKIRMLMIKILKICI